MSNSPALPPLPSAFSGWKKFYLANEINIFARYKNAFGFVNRKGLQDPLGFRVMETEKILTIRHGLK
jgi:hypothetical protein